MKCDYSHYVKETRHGCHIWTIVILLFTEQLQLRALLQRLAASVMPIEVMAEYTENPIRSLHLSGVYRSELEA